MQRADDTAPSRPASSTAARRKEPWFLFAVWLPAALLAGCPAPGEDPPPIVPIDEEPPECVEDADCDDRDPCTTGTCVGGSCSWARVEAEPQVLGSISTGAPAQAVFLSSTRWLQVAAGERGIETYDLNPLPGEPAVLERRRPTMAPAQGVTVIRDHVLALTGSFGIEAFPSGVSVPISQYQTLGPVRSVTRVDDLIVASVGSKGLEIIDYTDFSNPVRFSRVDTPGRAESTVRFGNSLHVADGLGGVAFVNFSERDAPLLLPERRRTTDGRVMALAIRSPYYLLAELGAGLGIIDTDQPDLDRLAQVQVGGPISGLSSLSIHTVLLAAGEGGLVMIDLLDPSRPSIVWSLTFNGPVSGISRSGERVAVALGEAGAAVVDLACSAE